MSVNPYESPATATPILPEREKPKAQITKALLSLILPAICATVAFVIMLWLGLRPRALFGMIFGGIGGFVGGLLNNLVAMCFKKS